MAIKSVTIKIPSILPPVRRTGDTERDLRQLSDYADQLYKVLQGITLEIVEDDAPDGEKK